MPTLAEFFLTIIPAVAYLTWVIVNTEGPYGWFALLRWFGTQGDAKLPGWQRVLWPVKTTLVTFGEMAQCAWCASFWMGLIVLGLFLYTPLVVWVLAACGYANALRTAYQHLALPRENKVRIDTAKYLKEHYGTNYAVKYLELGNVQEAFKAANAETV